MGIQGDLRRLLKNSLITGVPQIVSTRGGAKRALRILVFVGCAAGFFWQTFTFLTVYWTYPTVVDVEYYYPDEFDLPALSVCSYNSIKSRVFCERFPSLCYPNASLDEFCKMHGFFCDPNREPPGNESYPTVTPRELPDLPRYEYRDMGMAADEMVVRCLVYEAPRISDCTKNYQNVNVFDTKGLPSNCYTYNSMWGKTGGAQSIRTQTVIAFYLKTDKAHATQFYSSSPFAIQLSLHTPYAVLNPFRNGFSIDPCSNYFIFPSKQVNKLLPPPYTSACFNYTETWRARSGRGPLTKRLCSEECILNRSLEVEGCVDPYYITYPNMARICKTEAPARELYKSCSDACRPACVREDISVDVQEHSHFAQRGKHKEDECYSMILIFFNRMELVRYSYAPKYESVSLFSYIGGYLGLWLGISLVAISDVLEMALMLVRWAVRAWRGRNRIHPRYT